MKKSKRKIVAILSLVLAGSMIFSSCKGTGAQNGNTSEPGSDPGVAIEPSKIDLVNDSVPNLYLWIDENAEGYGTIEEMNSDLFHETKCTGTMDLEVPSDYTGGYGDSVQETQELSFRWAISAEEETQPGCWRIKNRIKLNWQKKRICSEWAKPRNGLCLQTGMIPHSFETVLHSGSEKKWVLIIHPREFP